MQGRIVGVDVARGVAVLGMFGAHLNDITATRDPSPAWLVVAEGRPSALFAVLAGLSIALFTGRRTVPRGPALVHGWLRVATRAGVIFVLGVLLMMFGTPVAVILPSYAVTFLLVAPFIALRPAVVGALAAVAGLAGPTLMAVLRYPSGQGPPPVTTARGESFLLDLVLTGYYPAVVWVAYMLLGLCLGRLDLQSGRVQGLLAVSGLGLLLLGYGGSDLLRHRVTATSPLTEQLLRADPHSDTTFEVVGNAGVALLVLAVVLVLTTAPGVARGGRLLLHPLAAVGAMALTAYSVHIVAIAILGEDVVWYPESNAVLVWFVVVALVGCTLWARVVGRGPLEWLMRMLTVGAYRPPSAPAADSPAIPLRGQSGRDNMS